MLSVGGRLGAMQRLLMPLPGKMGLAPLLVLPASTSPCNNILSFVISNHIYFGFVLVPGEFIMNSVSHSLRKECKAWGKKSENIALELLLKMMNITFQIGLRKS